MTDAAALYVLLLLHDNIAAVSPISVVIGQSQHSLQKTSIILDLGDSKAIYLFTYTYPPLKKKKKKKKRKKTTSFHGAAE